MPLSLKEVYYKDTLPGGLADKLSPKDFDAKALSKGIEVELEHTNDEALAREIAMDHLAEDPKYYQKLEKMEESTMKIKTRDLQKLVIEMVEEGRVEEAKVAAVQQLEELLAVYIYDDLAENDTLYSWGPVRKFRNIKKVAAQVNPKEVSKLVKKVGYDRANKMAARATQRTQAVLRHIAKVDWSR